MRQQPSEALGPRLEEAPTTADVVVVGAGFGGLATALRLSELGARVVVCESLAYPGGCASTFTRGGYRFEAGATLFSGFGEGQLFRRWIERYGIEATIDWPDPIVELRTPIHRLSVPRRREALVASFAELPGAPRDAIHGFFDRQEKVADISWSLMDDPALMPPFDAKAIWRHARRLRHYLPLVPLLGRSLESVLRNDGLDDFPPLRLYLDALCQITVQCPLKEAEALFALAAMDYYFRGTGHVRGGIGRLGWGLVEAIRTAGSTVMMSNHVSSLESSKGRWRVGTRRGTIDTPAVVANVLPQNLWALTGSTRGQNDMLDELADDIENGWGACMIYRVSRHPRGAPSGPHHLELVRDPSAPFVEGNHLFCSVSGECDEGRAPEGYRTLTVSTHVPASKLRRTTLDPAATMESIHEKMRQTLLAGAPEWEEDVVVEWTASPRTFQRFTKRYDGYVGGIPRRVGLKNYRGFKPRIALPGLYLVGDTVFPGQSTLATAVGGYKLAEVVARAT